MFFVTTDLCDSSVFDGGDDAAGIRAIAVAQGLSSFDHGAGEYTTIASLFSGGGIEPPLERHCRVGWNDGGGFSRYGTTGSRIQQERLPAGLKLFKVSLRGRDHLGCWLVQLHRFSNQVRARLPVKVGTLELKLLWIVPTDVFDDHKSGWQSVEQSAIGHLDLNSLAGFSAKLGGRKGLAP